MNETQQSAPCRCAACPGETCTCGCQPAAASCGCAATGSCTCGANCACGPACTCAGK